jgi:hypothetical protein
MISIRREPVMTPAARIRCSKSLRRMTHNLPSFGCGKDARKRGIAAPAHRVLVDTQQNFDNSLYFIALKKLAPFQISCGQKTIELPLPPAQILKCAANRLFIAALNSHGYGGMHIRYLALDLFLAIFHTAYNTPRFI